jgi:hypothetical protein
VKIVFWERNYDTCAFSKHKMSDGNLLQKTHKSRSVSRSVKQLVHLRSPEAKSPETFSERLSIREFLGQLLPRLNPREPATPNLQVPHWPPDVFALCMSLLLKGGAYCAVLKNWPPRNPGKRVSIRDWVKRVRHIGVMWQRNWANAQIPTEVSEDWKVVLENLDTPVNSLAENVRLSQKLLELCAMADEACSGIGLPQGSHISGNLSKAERAEALFQARIRRQLRINSSACHEISSDRVRTLPKMRTAQSGLTIRSLSHHIALWSGGDEVRPRWNPVGPFVQETSSINLLLVPWPISVMPSQFSETEGLPSEMMNMAKEDFGFFTFEQQQHDRRLLSLVEELHKEATKIVGNIDGVILPEAALTQTQHEKLRATILKKNAFLISGIGKASEPGVRHGENYIGIDLPPNLSFVQRKHHRWKLDESQIHQYGLGSRLDPGKLWWEHIDISQRELTFLAMQAWLVMTVLICEDLARPDPVGDLVRAVGPNLVIALLMDGPQLKARWGARYATTLADDPGCSVLTLTSIGMATLSRPDGVMKPSRIVALWKDATSGSPREIELPEGADGIVICLTVKYLTEWTADGRSDEGTAGYPLLSGIHPIQLSSNKP